MAEFIKVLMIDRNKKIIQNFEVGDEVSWEHTKNNIMQATITKINLSTASVITDDRWKYDVPAHQLKKEDFLRSG
jgi:hypothetical protein